jgi:hypothetical protein
MQRISCFGRAAVEEGRVIAVVHRRGKKHVGGATLLQQEIIAAKPDVRLLAIAEAPGVPNSGSLPFRGK